MFSTKLDKLFGTTLLLATGLAACGVGVDGDASVRI